MLVDAPRAAGIANRNSTRRTINEWMTHFEIQFGGAGIVAFKQRRPDLDLQGAQD